MDAMSNCAFALAATRKIRGETNYTYIHLYNIILTQALFSDSDAGNGTANNSKGEFPGTARIQVYS